LCAMFKFFYDLALILLALIALPKLIWDWFKLGKYRESLSQRLGITPLPFDLTPFNQVIWIHAVSMGETRAVISLFRLLKKQHPHAAILISSTTETGHAEAKRSMPEAEGHFFLPLDFSWVMKRVMRQIDPDLLILVESDFWYNLVSVAKKAGAQVAVVNGKVSERSAKRFTTFSLFTHRLFSNIDLLCVQSQRFADRFREMGIPASKIGVTGNLKFDAAPQKMSSSEKELFKKELGVSEKDRVIVIGSTHTAEEEMLLSALEPLWEKFPSLKIILVPRHPERFDSVAAFLEKKYSWSRFSQPDQKKGKVILIDAMGQLNRCFQISEIAIIGGSFVEGIGGHNIFEPVLLHVPVLFGPHMEGQRDLVDLVLSGHAGKQVNLSELATTVSLWLTNHNEWQHIVHACDRLSHQVQGSLQRTFSALTSLTQKEEKKSR
jgi:3-deoxy-D-manno-octulosonic-acid transferase